MFYSNEILGNSQYGVATVWLAATVGKGTAGRGSMRPLCRKAVDEVNIPKACETIIDPGAPLALRLQSNLLYGITRVFAQKCHYILADASKMQSEMMNFFRRIKTSETDPNAGRTKPHLITLQDDPAFDLTMAIPNMDALCSELEPAGHRFQCSTNGASQMTPGGCSQMSLSSSSKPHHLIELPSSSLHPPFRLPSDTRSSPLARMHKMDVDDMGGLLLFDDDEMDPINGVGLNFDADGNLTGIDGELELPAIPDMDGEAQPTGDNTAVASAGQEKPPTEVGDDLVLFMDEEALPDAEAFPVRRAAEQSINEATDKAPAKKKSLRPCRRKVNTLIDTVTQISRSDYRNLSDTYVDRMKSAAARKRTKALMATTQVRAKKHALAFLFGNRIARVGDARNLSGHAHPLAEEFAGVGLQVRLQGLKTDGLGLDETEVEEVGRRRKASKVIDKECNGSQRNVRPRIDQDAELGRGSNVDEGGLVLGDESAELGLDAVAPMEDRHSSTMKPWSSVAQRHEDQENTRKTISPSPLHDRGKAVGSIERRSDARKIAEASEIDTPYDFDGGIRAIDFHRGIRPSDELRLDNRTWIEFYRIADPETHSKSVAAQAFVQVLSLASKGAISVEQDGIDKKQPFGIIRLGV
ncbi:hypothetical protein RJ55_01759 [Drechmeria coniospora]|nr:hypothetical protein RJ55_01759 [Drechmeria coniospora]